MLILLISMQVTVLMLLVLASTEYLTGPTMNYYRQSAH